MADDPIHPEIPSDRAMTDLGASTRSATLQNLRIYRRFLAGALVAVAFRVGLPTVLGKPRPFDPPMPETLRIVVLIALATIEALLVLICLSLNHQLARQTLAQFSDDPADDHTLEARRVGFLVTFGFKSLVELACLLFALMIASQIFAMDDTDWSSANLGVVVLLGFVNWPIVGRMDRWASRMSLASWTRAIPPEFPG